MRKNADQKNSDAQWLPYFCRLEISFTKIKYLFWFILFVIKEQAKLWWCSIFLFFEAFQPQNVVILFLFSLKHSYLLTMKIIPDLSNYLLRSKRLYTPLEHPITSQKMTLMVFRLFFCKLIFRRNIRYRYFNLLLLNTLNLFYFLLSASTLLVS